MWLIFFLLFCSEIDCLFFLNRQASDLCGYVPCDSGDAVCCPAGGGRKLVTVERSRGHGGLMTFKFYRGTAGTVSPSPDSLHDTWCAVTQL